MENNVNTIALEQNDKESILPSYQRVQPYQFEPTQAVATEILSSDSDSKISSHEGGLELDNENDWVGNLLWCQCGECSPMPTEPESCCCGEVDLIDQLREDLDLECITEHPGFEGDCLNEYMVETSFYEFLENHGHVGDEEAPHL